MHYGQTTFGWQEMCHSFHASHHAVLQVVQTAAQPGILTCWLDILALANNSAQFYTADLPDLLAEKQYTEVRRCSSHTAALLQHHPL